MSLLHCVTDYHHLYEDIICAFDVAHQQCCWWLQQRLCRVIYNCHRHIITIATNYIMPTPQLLWVTQAYTYITLQSIQCICILTRMP